MPQKKLPNKLYLLPKQVGKEQLDDLELDGPITLRILDGITRDFTQAKWWRWWKTVKCSGLILTVAPATLTEKRAVKKDENELTFVSDDFGISIA